MCRVNTHMNIHTVQSYIQYIQCRQQTDGQTYRLQTDSRQKADRQTADRLTAEQQTADKQTDTDRHRQTDTDRHRQTDDESDDHRVRRSPWVPLVGGAGVKWRGYLRT